MVPRVVFMGTPDFAVSILETLISCSVNVVGVISQPDRPVGRKHEFKPTPVKAFAIEHGLTVHQPEKVGTMTEILAELDLDLIVTCAYGQFIPDKILQLPKRGVVNVHASLLPKYRGGAPIHTVILNGETETGVTLMRTIKKMDAGDMIAAIKVVIEADDTVGTLHDKLKVAGANLLKEWLPAILDGSAPSIPQDETQVSFAPNIQPQQEFISMNRDIQTVYNHVRGLTPWPIGYGVINGKKLKLISASMRRVEVNEEPGTVMGFDGGLLIACQNGILVVTQCQWEGKGRMSAEEFFRGIGKTLVKEVFE
jgi:methionyl-tRNA formyltransferase